MGMPFMAGMKAMTFYPLNILFIFGELWQWHASIFLQIFLSMVFVYALCRDFKLGTLPSCVAAISFSLCSLMVGFLEFVSDSHAILWIPLFILFSKRFMDKRSGWNLFFLGASISFSIFAGHLQYTGYGLVLLGAFSVYWGYLQKVKIRTFIFLFTSIGLGILVSSVQLIPAMELFSHSFRGLGNSYEVFTKDLPTINQFFRLFSPDFFGHPTERNLTSGYIETSGYFGVISFFFALYAVIFSKNKIVRFFAVFFLGAMLFSLRWPAEIIYLLKVPLLTSGSGGRIFVLALFSGSILAGFGLEEFLRGQAKRNVLSLFAFAATFAFGIVLNYKRSLFFHDIQFQILVFGIFAAATLIFQLFANRSSHVDKRKAKSKNRYAHVFVLFLIALIYFDLFRLGYRYLTFSNHRFLYPNTLAMDFVREHAKNNLGRSFGITEPEIETYLGIYSIETYNPLYIKRNAELLQALQKLPVDKLPVNKYLLTERTKNLKLALDFTGVSNAGVPKDASPAYFYLNTGDFKPSFDKVLSDERLDVYKNKDALHRFGLYYKYRTANSNEQLKIINERNFDPRNEILLEEELPIKLAAGTGSAKLLSSDVNSQKFSIKTDKPALFYISDTYFPGWNAKVNNKPTKIYRANYNFRAVLVPAGSSTIDFSYLPTHFPLAVAISIVSFVLLAGVSIFSNRSKQV